MLNLFIVHKNFQSWHSRTRWQSTMKCQVFLRMYIFSIFGNIKKKPGVGTHIFLCCQNQILVLLFTPVIHTDECFSVVCFLSFKCEILFRLKMIGVRIKVLNSLNRHLLLKLKRSVICISLGLEFTLVRYFDLDCI